MRRALIWLNRLYGSFRRRSESPALREVRWELDHARSAEEVTQAVELGWLLGVTREEINRLLSQAHVRC